MLYELLASGKMKIFDNQTLLLEQILAMYYAENGKVHKNFDHLVDALRYATMALPFARSLTINADALPINYTEEFV